MSKKCEMVVISDKAYNGMIRESFSKHPVETGGILLGYILDNGLWVVMEMIPPGLQCVHQTALFEYDQAFVNYLGTSVANQYKQPLQVLGLWHRHPGSMDYFSSTDDGTNADFASANPYGVISGLVNIDPVFRLTMYHLDHTDGPRPYNMAYSRVEVEVGDDLIPEHFFELRYIDSTDRNLHPVPTDNQLHMTRTNDVPCSPRNGSQDEDTQPGDETGDATQSTDSEDTTSADADTSARLEKRRKFFRWPRITTRKWFLPVLILLVFIAGIITGATVVPPIKKWLDSIEVSIKTDKAAENQGTDSK